MIKPTVDSIVPKSLASPNRDLNLRPLKTLTLLLVVASIVFFSPQRASADLQSAVDRYNKGEYESATAEILALAKAGDSTAKYTLGVIYVQGKGAPPDLKKGLKWLREAANEGHPSAQYSLGVMNATGQGMPQNAVRSLMWFSISGRNTNQNPVLRMKTISVAASVRKAMTPEQIKEAERLAAEWQPAR